VFLALRQGFQMRRLALLAALALGAAPAARAEEPHLLFSYVGDWNGVAAGGRSKAGTYVHALATGLEAPVADGWSVVVQGDWTAGAALSPKAIGDVEGVQGAFNSGNGLWLYELKAQYMGDRASFQAGRLSSGDAFPGVPGMNHGRLAVGLGAYEDSARVQTFDGRTARGDGGAYAWLEAPPDKDQAVSGFAMLQVAPRGDRDLEPLFLIGGVTVGRVSLGATAGRFSHESPLRGWEATLEANYRCPVNDHIALRPDLQWVISPAGRGGGRDALVLGVQIEASL
jgi:hypothetical protein